MAAEDEVYEERVSFLFNIRVPMWRYVLCVWLIAFVPSVAISGILVATGVIGEETDLELGGFGPVIDFVLIVAVSPIIETLLLSVILRLLSLVTKARYSLAVMSCVVWAGMHSLASPAWGIVVAWPFFVFSCAYLAWRRKSWWHAVAAACLIHMLQNLLPGFAIALTG
ncbi:MAG: hypothetical protein ISS79_01900 [Phycisphaerae bacterium]|nr:hypothetical protein [Phycisphaerae bacterium]